MNEEETEAIELDIEAKYVDRTEKEFLSNITYAECLFILTPENKYCDKIRELSVLKLCEIIEKLQKENEKLNGKILSNAGIYQLGFKDGGKSYTQKVKDKIEELKAQYKTALEENSTEAFILKCQITILQELIEEREEK